jgi:xanthine dehydrogenase accessory factor
MNLEKSLNTTAAAWLSQGRRVVAATLIDTDGSAPLDPGATMLVDDQGRIEGSVTGGCVEGALFEEAQAVLAGEPARMRTYGISDSQAVGVGLMCGGIVHILVHEVAQSEQEPLAAVVDAVADGREAAIATLLDGDGTGRKMAVVDGRRVGSFGLDERLDAAVERDALGCLAHGTSVVRRFGAEGEIMGDDVRAFIHAFSSPPRMVVFGAIDFSAAIATMAKPLGYTVTICDARRAFAEAQRFKVADEVVVDWPDRYLADKTLGPRDVVLVFTHDPKFDEPALVAALATGAGYIGALGSRKTHADRVRRLLDHGVTQEQLARVAAPCGLDIGARTPEETAVSILAEVIGRSAGRRGEPLSESSGAIHPARRVPAELS